MMAGLPPGVVLGTNRNDRIGPTVFGPPDFNTTNGTDKIFGNDGLDQICAQGGDDEVQGGSGTDLIDGGSGDDFIAGDGNNVSLVNGVLVSEPVPLAEQGNDSINAGEGNDTVSGDGGNDRIFGENGNDAISGGLGNDLIVGGAGNDALSGGFGDDTIFGGAGNDLIVGGDGNDVICAGEGNDTVFGGEGNDLIHGEGGNDRLKGEAGNDSIDGGAGRDRIGAGRGNDLVEGEAGNDQIHGDGGNDSLEGGEGNDLVVGGRGSDTIRGGDGDDVLFGGRQRGGDDGAPDYFVYDVEMEGAQSDSIRNFEEGQDKIVICSEDNEVPIVKIRAGDYDTDGVNDDAFIWVAGGIKIEVLNAGVGTFVTQEPVNGQPIVVNATNAENFIFVDTFTDNNAQDGGGNPIPDPFLYLCQDDDVPECPPEPTPIDFCLPELSPL